MKLSETPGRMDRHPPHLGEHTSEVLRSLGYDSAHVASLGARGVVGLPAVLATDGHLKEGV